MIQDLVGRKGSAPFVVRVGLGIVLYMLNLLLVLDFLLASLIGADPRLSVSALLGIRMHRASLALGKPGWLEKVLPEWFVQHCLLSASWWAFKYPSINRSIWR
jgi:hypothetical protein